MSRLIFFGPGRKNIFTLFLLATALMYFAAPVLAGTAIDGNYLLDRCDIVKEIGEKGGVTQRDETNNFMYCIGYFSAVLGMYNNTVLLDNYKAVPYCLPLGISWKPIAVKVISFMENHPELLHQPAEAVTTMALSEAFTCSK